MEGLRVRLHREGLLPDERLHVYHCSCLTCNSDEFPLRAQYDSSCDGELISKVLRGAAGSDENRHLYHSVQEAAVDADAEPGSRAGFHVHVSAGHLLEYGAPTPRANDALLAFLLWEPVLINFAAGRFTGNRANNRLMRRDLNAVLMNLASEVSQGEVYPTGRQLNQRFDSVYNALLNVGVTHERVNDALTPITADLMDGGWDRHMTLNLWTSHGTWEFRLWNSTRAAWRMRLWCGMSVALMNPSMHEQMLDVSEEPSLERLPTMLDKAGHGFTAELAARQVNYALKGATHQPLSVAA